MNEQEITLNQFRQNAEKYGVCALSSDWDECKNNKQIVDLCLSAKGIDYVSNAIYNGWGITPSIIAKQFKPFINGNYVCNHGIYTSELYCRFNGAISVRTTAIMIVNSTIDIFIPDYVGIFKIYAIGICNITLKGKGDVIVVCYGDKEDINIETDKCHVKYIHKEKASSDE